MRVFDKILWRVYSKIIYKLDNLKLDEKLANCICERTTALHACCKINNQKGNRTLIKIGSNTHVLGQLEIFPHGGRIDIGDYCYIGDNTRIQSMDSIRIGNRVMISHCVNIHDNVAHSSSAIERHEHSKAIYDGGHPKTLNNVAAAPVLIDDDAWIGFNATILKGVTVGKGAIVGACSVVTKNIEPYSIVVGNPARIVGQSLY